jgi:hypothetical protein
MTHGSGIIEVNPRESTGGPAVYRGRSPARDDGRTAHFFPGQDTMQEKLYLGVKNHANGEFFVAACSLPAQIGKQHDVKNQVLLDPSYPTISRIHGMIERTSRGFVYTDSSANGSRVGGLVVRDSRVALSPNFQIEIENYTITRVDAQPVQIYATGPDLVKLQCMELLPGRGVGVGEARAIKAKNPQRVSPIADRQARHEILDLNRWTEWSLPTVGHFEVNDQQVVWVASPGARGDAKKNKAPITQGRTPVVALDVIEIDGSRFEILHPHQSRIVCGYDRCHLLNPPPLEANCRFCGHHLANSGGFSRILEQC